MTNSIIRFSAILFSVLITTEIMAQAPDTLDIRRSATQLKGKTSGTVQTLRFFEADSQGGNDYIGLRALLTLTDSYILILPSVAAAPGEILIALTDSTLGWSPLKLVSGQTETISDTFTSAVTIATDSDKTYLVEAAWIARTSTGDTAAAYIQTAGYKNIGGALSEIDEQRVSTTEDAAANLGGWDVDFFPSGTNILVRAAGENGRSINWRVVCKIYSF